MAINLYPHQIKAVDELKNGAVLKGGVGTGKSITALAYFFTLECGGDIRVNGIGGFDAMPRPKDLYIMTTARKRDSREWEKECAPFGLSRIRENSFGSVKVTVDSWNNIGNYTDVKNAFFIFDEQRLVGSGAWVKAFYKITKSNNWIMLSATPGDNWLDYIPVFVANGYYKNRTEFLRQHVVYKNFSKFPQVSHYVETGKLIKLRNRLIVDMPYERHTVRHIHNVLVDHDEDEFEKVHIKRWHIYKERPLKDVGEMFYVMRKLVNSDSSRLKQVKAVMAKHPRLIVFYNFNYELDALRSMTQDADWDTRVVVAEWNGQKHEPVPEGEQWVYLVQYAAGAEAWNCTRTDATMFFSLNYSFKINEQAKGRIDRLNTPYTDLHYYILKSNSFIDKAISKSLANKKNFNNLDYAGAFEKAAA